MQASEVGRNNSEVDCSSRTTRVVSISLRGGAQLLCCDSREVEGSVVECLT